MTTYVPPKRFFGPSDLAVMARALDAAWFEIKASNLTALAEDNALKRAICLKLFSLTRSQPDDALTLRDDLLTSLEEDPAPADVPIKSAA